VIETASVEPKPVRVEFENAANKALARQNINDVSSKVINNKSVQETSK